MKKKTQGVTLIEVVTVLTIITVVGTIIGLVIAPRAKAGALSTQCTSNLRQLAAAWNIYRIDNDDAPPLSLKQIGPKIYYCPKDDIEYIYNGGVLLLSPEGAWIFAETFDPNNHAIVKCIQHHDHNGETTLDRAGNVHGKIIMRETPVLAMGQAWKTLSVTIDGSVRYRPFDDELFKAGTDLGEPAPPVPVQK